MRPGDRTGDPALRPARFCGPRGRMFPSSSGAERLTVNQRVGGSKPSWGARIPVLFIPMPGWWNGRHAGLRCRWPKGRGGSNPFPGTIMTETLVLAPRFRGYSSVASRDLLIEGTVGLSSTASRV